MRYAKLCLSLLVPKHNKEVSFKLYNIGQSNNHSEKNNQPYTFQKNQPINDWLISLTDMRLATSIVELTTGI